MAEPYIIESSGEIDLKNDGLWAHPMLTEDGWWLAVSRTGNLKTAELTPGP